MLSSSLAGQATQLPDGDGAVTMSGKALASALETYQIIIKNIEAQFIRCVQAMETSRSTIRSADPEFRELVRLLDSPQVRCSLFIDIAVAFETEGLVLAESASVCLAVGVAFHAFQTASMQTSSEQRPTGLSVHRV